LADDLGKNDHHLAPHLKTARQKPSVSTLFQRRQSPKCGSWVLHHSHVVTIRGDRDRLREKRRSGLIKAPPLEQDLAKEA
jgi:hypothetical protein